MSKPISVGLATVQSFTPSRIYVDNSVKSLELTRNVLNYFNNTPVTFLENFKEIKNPIPISKAKQTLMITRFKGDVIRPCQGIGNYLCCNYLIMSFTSNCHLECTYCILQDYLKNNPAVTLYANVDEMLDMARKVIQSQPNKLFRIGTGELSDSLALDSVTHLSKKLIPFAADQKNLILELKTKTDQIQNLINLDHKGKTIISWSVNPQKYIEKEEFKCSSLDERLKAARDVANAGYPIGFHFDPLLAFENWEKDYKDLVNCLRADFNSSEIAWISIGSLRYTPRLKKIIQERFPRSRLLYGELFAGIDGKVRYFREIREDLYTHVKFMLDKAFPDVPNYLCMETKRVWGNVYHKIPSIQKMLEEKFLERFS